jgi:hypothetical protein
MTLNRYSVLGEKCQSPSIRADVIEEIVWQQICDIIQNPDVVKQALEDKYDVCKQADYISELAQLKRRLEELKQAEQRLLVKYADPTNHINDEALNGALNEIQCNQQVVRDRMSEIEKSIVSEEEKSGRLNDVADILTTLRDHISSANYETKRKICELLVKEIRVGRNEDGATTFNVVYYFDKDLIKAGNKFEQLSARMSVRLLRRAAMGSVPTCLVLLNRSTHESIPMTVMPEDKNIWILGDGVGPPST